MAKAITYINAQKYVKDKDTAVTTFIESSLDKTQGIFSYKGLPDTIPAPELENLLQKYGHCIIAEHEGNLYAFTGGFSGENDVYNNPRFYTVTNVALQLSKVYEFGKDCILIKNDFKKLGMLPILQKYAVLLTDSEISLNTATILSRITMLISAPDDKTKASAEMFMQKILNGDFSIIGENGFFDGVKMQTSGVSNANYITQLIELIQYYKATFLNEIGLNANYNMKRERLTENEVAMNIDNLLPFIENMYTERKNAIEKVNEMFGTEIVVDYNSVWKTTHEHGVKERLFADSDDTTPTVEETTEEIDETEETETTTEDTPPTDETEETTTEEETTDETTEEVDETEENEETEDEKSK